MSVPKWILIGSITLFSIIGITALVKKRDTQHLFANQAPKEAEKGSLQETPIVSIPVITKASVPVDEKESTPLRGKTRKEKKKEAKTALAAPHHSTKSSLPRPTLPPHDDFPAIDRIFQLFTTHSSKLPIVETIHYTSSVPWLKGRPAWISDYATYYNTSRHFIARSLNGKPDYFSQQVTEGRQFNVFRKDKKIQFYLLVDISRCKMGFYYVDLDTNERVLLKTYRVGLGKLDPTKPSGTLTPLGRYSLGNRVAIYQPGVMGFYQDQKVEMIRVFGTRWLPLEQEVERTTASAKGYGIQGAPWIEGEKGQLIEKKEVIGAYDSDGCIRLSTEDIEELFSIVLTKPTFVEIVKDFHEAKLPGIEVAVPSR